MSRDHLTNPGISQVFDKHGRSILFIVLERNKIDSAFVWVCKFYLVGCLFLENFTMYFFASPEVPLDQTGIKLEMIVLLLPLKC